MLPPMNQNIDYHDKSDEKKSNDEKRRALKARANGRKRRREKPDSPTAFK